MRVHHQHGFKVKHCSVAYGIGFTRSGMRDGAYVAQLCWSWAIGQCCKWHQPKIKTSARAPGIGHEGYVQVLLSCLNGSINWLACFFYKIKLPCFCWLRRWSLPTGQRLLVHISTLGVWDEGEHKCSNEVPWETINIGLMSMRAYQH